MDLLAVSIGCGLVSLSIAIVLAGYWIRSGLQWVGYEMHQIAESESICASCASLEEN